MAGTITHRIEMSSVNGVDKEQFKPGSVAVVQTAKGQWSNTISVTTGTGASATTIPITGLSTYGLAYFHNLDGDNFISIGPSTTTGTAPYLAVRLKAGETGAMRLEPGVILRASADTAAAKLKVKVLED